MTRTVAILALATAAVASTRAQGRINANWPTMGADAQRTSWMTNDSKLSAAAMAQPGFQSLWKTKLDNQPAQLNALTQPLLLQNLISHKGFKALAFVGGSADVVYAIDYDLNRVYWKQRLSSAARAAAASVACPGGLTAITRTALVTPPGLPGTRPGSPGGPAAASVQPPQPPIRGVNPNYLPITNAVYAVSSGGMVHVLNPHIGDDIHPPVRFLPPGAKVAGLILIDNVLYAGTAGNCGGAANGVWAMDLGTENKTVRRWESNGGSVVGTTGPTFGVDGTVYAATDGIPRSGDPTAGRYSNAVVALEPGTLKLRDYFSAEKAFTSAPVAFRFKDRDLIAVANSDGRIYLLDARALGGSNHTTVLATSPEYAASEARTQALATWEEPNGTRWLLVPARSGVVSFKVVDQAGALSFERGWTSRDIPSPLPPTILNDVVFVARSGLPSDEGGASVADRIKRATAAVLYALDGRTGKELWNSGTTIASFVPGIAPAAGDSQVYVVTYDGTLYAFGMPRER